MIEGRTKWIPQEIGDVLKKRFAQKGWMGLWCLAGRA
jgi:hypothetical protein